MKKILLMFFGFLLLVAFIAGALLLMRSMQHPETPAPADDPFAGLSGGGGPTGTPSGEGITLQTRNGSTVTIPDITRGDQPEWAGPSGYSVAGGAETDYSIVYIPADGQGAPAQFLIRLLTEPIGEVRRSAEQELLSRLRLTQAELCDLDVQVWVTDDVNASFAGRDLRPSFCPGAVPLP